ncbi:MAG TPA: NAD(P)/FAD-dependent oxidoreductase, partial [Anaerolineales bacterium]
MTKSVAIVGGGPAGLMAAEVISAQGIKVDVYDAMPSVGRKLLMAGKSGLNITHSDPFDVFVSRYGKHRENIEPLLRAFGADQLREWVHSLGIDTFIGTSGRIFPFGMKASPLLRAWLSRLTASNVTFHLRHKWTGFLPDGSLNFNTPNGEVTIKPDAVVLALGGGSWSRLGS